jgi:hypothetical protein
MLPETECQPLVVGVSQDAPSPLDKCAAVPPVSVPTKNSLKGKILLLFTVDCAFREMAREPPIRALFVRPQLLRGSPHSLFAGLPCRFPHRAQLRVRRKLRNGLGKVLVERIATLFLNLAVPAKRLASRFSPRSGRRKRSGGRCGRSERARKSHRSDSGWTPVSTGHTSA